MSLFEMHGFDEDDLFDDIREHQKSVMVLNKELGLEESAVHWCGLTGIRTASDMIESSNYRTDDTSEFGADSNQSLHTSLPKRSETAHMPAD